MRKLILCLSLSVFCLASSSAIAGNLLETRTQTRQRKSAENYNRQQEYGTPLGGYRDTLGIVAPYGTEQPGYSPSYRTNSTYYNDGILR